MVLVAGQAAPTFRVRSDTGVTVDLAALQGQWVALFFLPAGGGELSNQLASELQQRLSAFEALGASVIGVGQDTEAKLAQFRERGQYTYPLLPDAGRQLARLYGVEGKLNWLRRRQTFLVTPSGNVARVWRSVKGPGHVAEVLSNLEALQRPAAP